MSFDLVAYQVAQDNVRLSEKNIKTFMERFDMNHDDQQTFDWLLNAYRLTIEQKTRTTFITR